MLTCLFCVLLLCLFLWYSADKAKALRDAIAFAFNTGSAQPVISSTGQTHMFAQPVDVSSSSVSSSSHSGSSDDALLEQMVALMKQQDPLLQRMLGINISSAPDSSSGSSSNSMSTTDMIMHSTELVRSVEQGMTTLYGAFAVRNDQFAEGIKGALDTSTGMVLRFMAKTIHRDRNRWAAADDDSLALLLRLLLDEADQLLADNRQQGQQQQQQGEGLEGQQQDSSAAVSKAVEGAELSKDGVMFEMEVWEPEGADGDDSVPGDDGDVEWVMEVLGLPRSVKQEVVVKPEQQQQQKKKQQKHSKGKKK